ncbi:tetratricopeptide repeat protein [Chengkuizengella axinellae]|uniref:Tetratricopeptide repeat protein n=1 Tax=Chengkuizengella axinellae TaxID=3064388 RepID=A0ABT9IVB9_9BACL|nr:tetratricopeptide repeat protein [Chengkuizengella sp. 2205SS18-9]MDP5273277.1 tetratricopeptide repeat protein [Chengkuizengella sp. 2205SS18-9]
MDDLNLQKAITLRELGKYEESNLLLLQMVEEQPNDASIHYQVAWSFDVMEKEREAVPYYEKAISLGLAKEELKDAYLGLGSTYRTLGEYEKSKRIFQMAIEEFPSYRALKVFYSMTLFNLAHHDEAMEILLNNIVETTNDASIIDYKRAIHFYSDKLSRVWE